MNELPFDTAINSLSPGICHRLKGIPETLKSRVNEIRLRTGKPVCLHTSDQLWFLLRSGNVTSNVRPDLYLVTPEDMLESLRMMCDYSLHSHQEDLKNGFITIRGGHRAGICGRLSMDQGQVLSVQQISSINLRIARQIFRAADPLVKFFQSHLLENTLVVGPPSSGKTTVLRDLARQLSDGVLGKMLKVALMDERGELAASFQGQAQTDVGISTDVFDFYPKRVGVSIAVRSMSPDIIICDEIGTAGDAQIVQDCLNAGVVMIASAHASGKEEILRRKQVAEMILSGEFKYLVLLGRIPGTLEEIIDVSEINRKSALYTHDEYDRPCLCRPLSKADF